MIRFLPWRLIVKYAARRYGVLDPAALLARLRGFAQPSEVGEPLELLRAGILFHARGLINTKAIQHNLDWVWPFWVHRQFNPGDRSFVPRAFSFSHINLTHRNWTAVGEPGLPVYPLVDPRGLVTALYDGWSLDFWIVTRQGRRLLPSKLEDEAVRQRLELQPTLRVVTQCQQEGLQLELASWLEQNGAGVPQVITQVCGCSDQDGWLVVAVRPYNPEGVQFIQRINLTASGTAFRVNDEATVELGEKPAALRMAHYAEGDVYHGLPGAGEQHDVRCKVGMATGAALFELRAGSARHLRVGVSLERDFHPGAKRAAGGGVSWAQAVAGSARLEIPDERMKFLYDAALRTLLLLSAEDLVPGPFTYRRFWFRDACLMLHPLLVTGQLARAERIMATFPHRQTLFGYFLSQNGEWDSNGQVLWIVARHSELTGRYPGHDLEQALRRGVRWLARKRHTRQGPPGTDGLLPAGFSAEHLGPNDYYYWDDYWAWAGLLAVGRMWQRSGDDAAAAEALAVAGELEQAIEASLAAIPAARSRGAIPAAPGRRMDAGAIGSMVADYPLQLYPPGDARIARTTAFLMERCFYQGGFFQEMIHSGINAYLTINLAQTLLRAGDGQFAALVRRVAELATATGQWPEAIHPQTLGGCMGDGQHGWAAGEWIMMMRNCFVREEADHLVIGSGILPEWLASDREIRFGPTHTAWGPVSVCYQNSRLSLETRWRGAAPRLVIALPGFTPIETGVAANVFQLQQS